MELSDLVSQFHGFSVVTKPGLKQPLHLFPDGSRNRLLRSSRLKRTDHEVMSATFGVYKGSALYNSDSRCYNVYRQSYSFGKSSGRAILSRTFSCEIDDGQISDRVFHPVLSLCSSNFARRYARSRETVSNPPLGLATTRSFPTLHQDSERPRTPKAPVVL